MARQKITLRALRSEMVDLDKSFRQGAREMLSDTVIEVAKELIFNTPVDTGRARSNWIGSSRGDRQRMIPPYSPYPKRGNGDTASRFNETANGNAALQQIAQSVLARPKNRNPDKYHIVNAVPYVELLNYGTSQQAGRNFIELAFQVGTAKALKKARSPL